MGLGVRLEGVRGGDKGGGLVGVSGGGGVMLEGGLEIVSEGVLEHVCVCVCVTSLCGSDHFGVDVEQAQH